MADAKPIPEVAARRPFSMGEALMQILRRWYIVLVVGVIGSGGAFFIKDKLRPSFPSEATFRIRKVVAPPKMEGIQVPQEEALEPEDLAKQLMQEAVATSSLRELFKAHPKVFDDEVERGEQDYIGYIRHYVHIIPKTPRVYLVKARAFGAEQARLICDWVAKKAIGGYRDKQLGRAAAFGKFVKGQIDGSRKTLATHEASMIAFLRANPSLLVKAMAKDRRLQTSGPDRLRVQATQRVLQSAGSAVSAKDPELRGLIDERTRLRRELKALSGDDDDNVTGSAAKLKALQEARGQLAKLLAEGIGKDHPSVKAARRQVNRLQAAVNALRPGQKSATSRFEARLRAKLTEVGNRIRRKLGKKAAARAPASPQAEANWSALVRRQQLLVKQADGLNNLSSVADFNSRLIKDAGGALGAMVLVATLAEKPDGMPVKVVFVAGVMFAFIFGAIVALLIGMVDRKIYYAHEIETLVAMPLLATLHRQRGSGVEPTTNRKLLSWSTVQETVEVDLAIESDTATSGNQPMGDLSRLALPPASGGQQGISPAMTSMVLPGNLLSDDAVPIKQTVSLRIHTVPVGAPNAAGWFIADDPRGRGADQMRLLAGRLQIMLDEPAKVIVITSWESNVGRSTVAGNLALALAETRRKTIVFDACGGDGSLTRAFGLRPDDQTCLFEQLTNRMNGVESSWILHKVAESLYVVPASTAKKAMGPMLSSVAFVEMVDQLRALFDVLVIDAAPLSEASDAVTLAQQADTLVNVVGRKRSTLTGAADLVQQVDPDRLAGVVFNER